MQNKQAGDLTYLATLIAVELTKNKSLEEIFELKTLLSQVLSTINTISFLKTEK